MNCGEGHLIIARHSFNFRRGIYVCTEGLHGRGGEKIVLCKDF